jgi:signal transduction histidine kinase/CheY-like chemotaxis protein/HPt (histidine-containing phosphotransfer) domain-containing protein
MCGDANAPTLVFIANCTPLIPRNRSLHGVLVTLDEVTELERSRIDLQQARDAAQHANEAKSRFLAMMSHEIRTPLNGVFGSLQLLGGTSLGERQARYVEAARFSASTLLHLINDILDFSKIEAGQLELSPVAFDLERCLDETMQMLAHVVRAKGLVLASEIAPEVNPRLLADPDRIRQIVINLVNNAVKFTERGSVTVRVSLASAAPGRQRLRFEVADTGIGIPEAKMHRLFKAFSQVDSSTSRRYGGTGLGLVISRQLCEMMGGSIEVASREGAGTIFTFDLDLPLAPAAPATAAEPTTPPAPPFDSALVLGLHEFEARTVARALLIPVERILVRATLQDLQAHGIPQEAGAGRLVAVIGGITPDEARQHAAVLQGLLPRPAARVIGAAYGPDLPAPGSGVDGWVARPLGRSRLLLAAQELSRDAPQAVAARGCPDLTGVRVLLAEDNEVGRMVVSDMLTSAGALCDTAADGNAVLAALSRSTFDVVLMDCFMPGIDGFEATRRIREQQAAGRLPTSLPIIALTAKAMRGDEEECLRAGMDGYLSKPVDAGELLRVVAKHTGRAARAPDPPAGASEALAGALRERFGAKTELLSKLAGAFRSTAAEDIGRIQTGLRDRDPRLVEQAAHRLAGGAGFVCADRVQALARELECLGHADQVQGLEELVARLKQETAGAVRTLDRVVTGPTQQEKHRETTPQCSGD